jgi:hypothetical protein
MQEYLKKVKNTAQLRDRERDNQNHMTLTVIFKGS